MLIVVTVGAGIGLVVSGGARVDAVTPSTVTVSSQVLTVPAGQHVNDQVSCPSGTQAVGGGGGANGLSTYLTSNGPLVNGQFLIFVPDGASAANLTGWNVSAVAVGNSAGTVIATVICTQPGGLLPASFDLRVTSAPIAVNQWGGEFVKCPATEVAVGGGVDTADSQNTYVGQSEALVMFSGNPRDLSSLPAGAYGPPIGWTGEGYNHSANATSMKVAAICAPASSVPGLSTMASAPATHGVGVSCPAGDEVTDGGVGPSQGFGSLYSSEPDSQGGPPAKSWVAAAPGGPNVASAECLAPPPSPSATTTTTGPPPAGPVVRLAGGDRVATAIVASQNAFVAGSAKAVVIARSDAFADALAGTPLAAAKHAPLLLTASSALDQRDMTEISRVLPAGSTVYVLGGSGALDPSIDQSLVASGYQVVRFAGINRFGTAAKIASDGLGAPAKIIEATGLNFPDALSAGAAAASASAAVLLTADSSQAPETSAYLAAHPPAARWAVGGQAAAADPSATPLVGVDRFDTSAKTAAAFFTKPTGFGAALGTAFPDALAGGAHTAMTTAGPLLLVLASAPLPAPIANYISANPTIKKGFLYGGVNAVDDTTLKALDAAVG
ncbi:MAG: cell wall-binding repeat-containing protein [Acidimicrobiales bacterium]